MSDRSPGIRAARPDDAAAIARVHVSAWQFAYAHVFPADALAGLSADERKARWRARTDGVVVAELDGSVAGFASFGASRDDDGDAETGELYAIYVDPACWGQGAGRALIRTAERELRERGFAEATLWVLDDNPRARRFYELAGWYPDGATKRTSHLGTQVTEVRYRRPTLP